MRALAKNPKDRFTDVLLFARELQAALATIGTATDSNGLVARMKSLFRTKDR